MNPDRTKSPEVSDFGPLNIDRPQEITLAKGNTLFVLDKGDADACMVSAVFPMGNTEAPSPKLMNLMNATWREGSKHHSPDEIADMLDYHGAWVKIDSSSHHTILSIYCLTSQLSNLLPLFAEIILHPTFDLEAVESMKGKIKNSIRIGKDKVKVVAKAAMLRQLLGQGHPLAKVETEDDVDGFNVELLSKLHESVVSTMPTVFMAGRLDNDAVAHARQFAEMITPEHAGVNSTTLIPEQPDYSHMTVSEVMKDKDQTCVVMSFPSINRSHPDYNDLRITVMALGGYFGSRLMSNIREEKGYTYGINASLVGANELGYVTIECECDNSYVDSVIAETKKELSRLASEPMTDDELTTVKRIIKSSLANMLDSPFDTMGYYIGKQTIGFPDDYFHAQQRAMEGITPERIMEIASTYLNPEKMFLSTAGEYDPALTIGTDSSVSA
ncbi:MAG: pitrilysin family protein [Muribaculaceae bacterium]|nr:pitrilysin family protein [Muribaculaceae bacterium]